MRFQLPSDVAITWAANDQLRIGTTVHSVTVADVPLVHDLIDLLRRSAELALLRGVVDASDCERLTGHTLLRRILTCCERLDGGMSQLHVCIRAPRSGDRLAGLIAAEVTRHGAITAVGGSDAVLPECADFVIEICDRAIPPGRYLEHLSRDRPHLLVTRDAGAVLLGPLVIPGYTACIRCVELQRVAADPHWLVTATQLLDCAPANPPAELELLAALECGLFLGQLRQQWRTLRVPETLASLRFAGAIELVTAAGRSQQRVSVQHGCGCQTPAETERAPQPSEPKTAAGVHAHA